MQSVRKEANFILGPKSNSHPRRPKSASHHVHSVARQLFAELPQRLPRAPCVAAMRELRPHLHAACTCTPALFLVDARGSPSTPAHFLCAPHRLPRSLAPARARQSAAAMNVATELAAAATASTLSLLRPNQARHHLLLIAPRLWTS